MGGIFKRIYSIRLQLPGAESTRSLADLSLLRSEAAGLPGEAMLAGGHRGTGLHQGSHPGHQNTLKMGFHLTAPAHAWNWHKPAMLFSSLHEIKHPVLQVISELLTGAGKCPDLLSQYRAAWLVLSRDVRAAAVFLAFFFLFSILALQGPALKPGEAPRRLCGFRLT